uniref:Uncharacterized protein n=1 Tax=Anguilla anguilla TaxID=7936 RepID=A0A0E9RFB9_ANGAN
MPASPGFEMGTFHKAGELSSVPFYSNIFQDLIL